MSDAQGRGGPPIEQKWVDCKDASPDGRAETVGSSCIGVVNSALSVGAFL